MNNRHWMPCRRVSKTTSTIKISPSYDSWFFITFRSVDNTSYKVLLIMHSRTFCKLETEKDFFFFRFFSSNQIRTPDWRSDNWHTHFNLLIPTILNMHKGLKENSVVFQPELDLPELWNKILQSGKGHSFILFSNVFERYLSDSLFSFSI